MLRLHVIWVPRRRRKVLVGPVADRLDVLLREKAAALELEVLRLASHPDQVHLFLGLDPNIAPAQIAYEGLYRAGLAARVCAAATDAEYVDH